jgi:demethylmenaquinone methyltransferase / 2-methoxy-6-polyprenyl-1,4-benzoquinol methylase
MGSGLIIVSQQMCTERTRPIRAPASLRGSLATPEGKSRYVRWLFGTIAERYDLITVLLSYGQDARWKRRLIRLAALEPNERVLDLACGTGDLTWLAQRTGASAVGLDITPRMLELARRKMVTVGRPGFLNADMEALPFVDRAFQVVTTGYGLRNVPRLETAVREICRVLAPGGRFLSLDFNRPANFVVRAVYLAYLTAVGAALGWVLHGNTATYRYIPASIQRHPGAAEVGSILQACGFRQVRVVPVLGGLMVIHQAWK